ncbi:MAG: MFS transporter [Eubacterium sp.]|nr:MFS transporter [Eubacterium sp.]
MEEYTEKQRKAALRMAVVTSFVTTFMGSALNLSIPAIETEFAVSGAMVGWIVTAYTLTVAAFSVPMGKLADATGRRRILLIGIAVFGLLNVAISMVANIKVMVFLRVLQGIFGSMIFATNNAILISVFPGNQRGKVLGISTAAVYTGLSLGPVLGGFLNQNFGWRSIFLFSTAIAVCSFLFAWMGAPRDQKGTGLKVDAAGSILFIFGIASFLYGLTSLTTNRFGWIFLVIGIALGILFFFVESRAEDPVIRVTMFTKDLVFTLSNFAALLNYGSTFAITYLVSIFLQIVFGYSSQTAGLILVCMPVVQACIAPVSGRASDKIAPYKLATAGMLFCVSGLIVLSFLQADSGIAHVIVALVLEGIGFGLFSSPNTNAIMSCVEKKDYSVANSILATMRNVGHSSSMSIVTIIVGLFLGTSSLDAAGPDLLIRTMHTCFHVFIVLCTIGVFFSLARKK